MKKSLRRLAGFTAMYFRYFPALMCTLWLGGCGEEPGPAAEELRIGALVPQTGIAASVGPEVISGIEFVLSEAGYSVNGKKISLVIEDESDSPATAVTRARKLVEEDKVDVVIGP